MKPKESFLPTFDKIVRVGAVTVASVGIVVIFGWVFNIPLLKSVLPGLMTMKLNTACGFLVAGTALWLLHTSARSSRSFRLGLVLSVFVALLGVLNLIEYIFAVDLGIDQLLMQDVEQKLHPGRLAETTAFGFLLVGVAMFDLRARRQRRTASTRCLAAVVLFVSTLAIVGYAYGVSSLYAVGPYSSMALHTALAFLVLSLSILAADPTRGIVGIAASDSAGGFVVRRLIPIIPVTILTMGWVAQKGHMAGLYDTNFGLALVEVLSITVCVLAITWTAFKLRKVDFVRKLAEELGYNFFEIKHSDLATPFIHGSVGNIGKVFEVQKFMNMTWGKGLESKSPRKKIRIIEAINDKKALLKQEKKQN